jgi:hypothetical protein
MRLHKTSSRRQIQILLTHAMFGRSVADQTNVSPTLGGSYEQPPGG